MILSRFHFQRLGLLGLALCCGLFSEVIAEDDSGQNRLQPTFGAEQDWFVGGGRQTSFPTSALRGLTFLDEQDAAEVQIDTHPLPENRAGNSFESELARLQHRIDQLESAEQTRTEFDSQQIAAAATQKADEIQRAAGWQDMSTDKWTVKLGGHVQLDYINWANADPAITDAEDYFQFRRLRLVADGTGYGQCDFRLQMTLEPESINVPSIPNKPLVATLPEVKDAYFSMNEIPGIGRFRIGNFFVPFGLEQVTNDTNNVFLERSIPTGGVFTADREVGAALYNCSDDQSVTWTTGVFFDSISESLKSRLDDNQGARVSGRLTWTPFYDEPSNGRYLVHTGIGILHTHDQDGVVRFRARPQIHEGPRLIDSGDILADNFTTGNLEFAAVMGPLTLQSEAFVSGVQTNTSGVQTATGGYAHLSYFLTGENRIYERFGQHGAQFGRSVPTSNFFIVPGAISPGAWELKARYSNLNLNQFHKGAYNDLTTGFNWYWSDRTRVMFDWIHPVTTAQAAFGQTQSDLLAMRFDFNW